jgi:hypothetical protein
MGKRLCTKGTGSAVPYRLKLMRALAPEVRLLTVGLSRFGPFVLTSAKNRTSAAKAVDSLRTYGTAKPVPFVEPWIAYTSAVLLTPCPS